MNFLLPVLFHLPGITAAGYFFSDHGFLNNSCPISPCGVCSIGQYRLGCANASSGVCTNCTGIPNATFNSHGWFNNSCNFTCNEGFIAGPGRACSQVIKRYTIDFQVSITVTATANKTTFNMTEYIRGVANQTGCGQCGNVSINPATCGTCKIKYEYTTSVPIVYRRLLASASQVDVKTTITIDDNKKLAEAAAASISSESLAANLPSVASLVATTPTVAVEIIVVSPPAPPPPPPPATTTPAPTPSTSGESSNVGAIAGGVAGGVVGLILVVVLVVVFTRKPAPTPSVPPNTPSVPPTTSVASRFTYRQKTQKDTNPKLSSQFLYVPRI